MIPLDKLYIPSGAASSGGGVEKGMIFDPLMLSLLNFTIKKYCRKYLCFCRCYIRNMFSLDFSFLGGCLFCLEDERMVPVPLNIYILFFSRMVFHDLKQRIYKFGTVLVWELSEA